MEKMKEEDWFIIAAGLFIAAVVVWMGGFVLHVILTILQEWSVPEVWNAIPLRFQVPIILIGLGFLCFLQALWKGKKEQEETERYAAKSG